MNTGREAREYCGAALASQHADAVFSPRL